MDQWSDNYSLTDPSTQEGLRDSIKYILDIISKEVEFVPPSNIVLLGISQRCATAIHALLAGQYRLGGFIGIAGWLPFHKQVADLSKLYGDTLQLTSTSRPQANTATPALLCHCTDDDFVDINLGHQLRDALMASGLNMDITFKEFAKGAHWIPAPVGFDAIVEFLRSRSLDWPNRDCG